MKKITAVVIGAGNRANCYAEYAKNCPEKLSFVAVADPDKNRATSFQQKYDIKDENVFGDWKDLLSKPKMADVAFICTQDNLHFEPAMKALDLGYNLLLEKPIAVSAEECKAIAKKARDKNLTVAVCHVLRYTKFYSKIKEIIDNKVLGDMTSIIMRENVGILHMSHSFVRGNWHKSEDSNPMLIAKCCHDLDLIYWFTGKHCKSVSSFGSLQYFKEENAPKGSPKRCLDGCPYMNECMFYAPRTYSENKWLSEIILTDTSSENITKYMKDSPYGKCVFHNDNNVVDHQVVNLSYENGLTVTLIMSGFTEKIDREIYIMGTKGELRADLEDGYIKIIDFASGLTTEYKIAPIIGRSGHGGGDMAMMNSFINSLALGEKPLSNIEDSIESHLMGYAAEKARLDNTVINFEDFIK